jgi:hypothetical protein
MIKLPETKEEILNFIDNLQDFTTPEAIAFKEKVINDEDFRNFVKEIKASNREEAKKLKEELIKINSKR